VSGELSHRATGTLEKLRARVDDTGTVAYRLPLGDAEIALNHFSGSGFSYALKTRSIAPHAGEKRTRALTRATAIPVFRSWPPATAAL
jgi:hypothetical protein